MSAAKGEFPGLGPQAEKPIVNPGADFKAHPLSPVEGFVLSRVDGKSSYADICSVTGLGVAKTVEILVRLRALGLIANPGETTRRPTAAVPYERKPTEPGVRGRTESGADERAKSPPPAGPTLLERLDDRSVIDPADLLDAPDLDPEVKKRILRVARLVDSLSPTELLGVPADADERALKKAYFAASKELHPDRFYGKDLGIFRPILEKLFKQCATAFEVLMRDRGRSKGHTPR
jgi:hypothetical protein